MDKSLRIISLGGFGNVTQNMFIYEYQGSILIIDCGIGFINKISGESQLVVPDTSYLQGKKDRIKAIVFTHGHDDHIGGLPFLLKKLGGGIPLYASRLTTALISEKLEEYRMKANITVIDSTSNLQLFPFSLSFVHVTHSIPDSLNCVIQTPAGLIYHAADFKFDWTPVMDRPTEVGKIVQVAEKGITLLLSDCLRSEKPGYTFSEQMIEESFEREISDCQGKFIITTMSSNVSRWQQAINVIARHNRKVVLIGRSVKHVIETAANLNYLKIPRKLIIPIKMAPRFRPSQLAFLVAGSQAQAGSALEKISSGEINEVRIISGDKVVFSADYIPGNEVPIHRLVDRLSRLGADVSYSEILDDLHVSGHGSQSDLALMIALTHPQWLLPIGGDYRHMKQYAKLAQRMGHQPNRILLPDEDQSIEVAPEGTVRFGPKFPLHPAIVQ